MIFLLYRHTNDGIFDYFRKIPDHSRTFSETCPKVTRTLSNIFRKFRKISGDFRGGPEDVSMIHAFQYNLRDKLDISESSISSLVRIWNYATEFRMWFCMIFFPVKHLCLYNKKQHENSCDYSHSVGRLKYIHNT